VRLLSEGLSYRDIADRTGASTATVTRINQWLQHGTGGYQMMLERMAGATS
jgi:TrpR-related protein YerC/YecD